MEENQQNSTIRPRPGIRTSSRRPVKKINYRMVLCIALLVCFLLAVLFFSLFLSRGGKIKELETQIATLTETNQSLQFEIDRIAQEQQAALSAAVAALPDPTTAQTEALADLIPQLTESVYVIRSTGSGYQYLSVPAGAVRDQLTAYRDNTAGYAAASGEPNCTYWVLFDDRVIGLAEGDTGFVSTERGATGTASTVPQGMTAFVATLFA